MQQILIAAGIGVLIGMVGVGVPAILSSRARERAFQKVTEAYERIIHRQDANIETAYKQVGEVLDRFYGAKNLAPGNVDMAEVYKERREEEKQKQVDRRNGGALPPRIGKIDDIQARMEKGVKDGTYARPT